MMLKQSIKNYFAVTGWRKWRRDFFALVNPHASFEQVVQSCKMAEIHGTIEALLKRPKVLIFDEATSALDDHTAAQFARTINALKGKVTMLFITHAMPRGLQIDEVIELDGDSFNIKN